MNNTHEENQPLLNQSSDVIPIVQSNCIGDNGMDLMNDTFLYKANFMYPKEPSYLQGATCTTVQWQDAGS